MNAAAERVFGYVASELVGQSLHLLIPDRMRPGHDAGMGRYLATGQRRIPWQGIRVPMRTKSGREIPVEISFGEFIADGRRLFSGFLRDISERVESERALTAVNAELEAKTAHLTALNAQLQERTAEAERARAAAEAANQAKTDFLSIMSHELRTPLHAIGGYAEMLELGVRGPVTDAQRTDLTRIRRAGHYLQSLINDLLNITRLEAGEVAFDLQAVRVDEVMAEVEALVLPQLQARQLAFHRECHCAIGAGARSAVVAPAMHADPEKLRQIILNLVTNAIKFTAPGGVIRLHCDDGLDRHGAPVRGEEVMRLHVSDTGRGIPASALERIFDPFVQVDRGLLGASQEGIGLGLSISRNLARAMGGELTVASEVGKGSTFTLTLPQAPIQAPAQMKPH